ncbi:alpha/beta hydrolase [Permianibacter sp. IMCC34836]|uniref:alpha/beta fold hydrolase n=1 Tax=Permianibacter fluminis TaxID=2738515 RepID=UPI001551A447|nr:alpha/beta hydrolase [Permianibacter fluminis]NQD37154.1 alpha/beta hydrolase [Permianibacter fluminis]
MSFTSVDGLTSIEQWSASGSYMRWQNQQIFVRSAGAGEALLLIHGFPTASWDWQQVAAGLQHRFRIICFDMIGFGLSDKPRNFQYSIAAQADLAEAVLAHFGITRARVLAHDYGDTVAQELLARQLEGQIEGHQEGQQEGQQAGHARWQLQQLFLLNGGLFPESHRPVLLQTLLASPLGGLLAALTRYPRFAANMQRICAHSLSAAELNGMWQLLTRQDGLRVMAKLIAYMAERKRWRERWVGALIQADIPVRLIAGMADPISGAHMVARYRELIPAPDVVELAGVGHYPQLQASAAVVAAITEACA